MTRSQVTDTERSFTFQVATLFINVQLAESTLELAEQDLNSFQKTVDISESQYKAGGISENDYPENQAPVAAISDRRQQARALARPRRCRISGNSSVTNPCLPTMTLPVHSTTSRSLIKLEELQTKALQNRPDLRAAQQGHDGGEQSVRLGQSERKAGCHRFGQLFARQRDQRVDLLREHPAPDLRPQPGRNRADAVMPSRRRRSNSLRQTARC